MDGKIYKFFAEDHRRLEMLLEKAFSQPDKINDSDYAEFRGGLLRHIALEEKILLPSMQHDGKPYAAAAQLRLDHGAIAALLVLPPSIAVKNVLQWILMQHNSREEGIPGLYHDCESAFVHSSDTILNKVHQYPDVPMMPYNITPRAMDAARRAVARAGYNFDRLTGNNL